MTHTRYWSESKQQIMMTVAEHDELMKNRLSIDVAHKQMMNQLRAEIDELKDDNSRLRARLCEMCGGDGCVGSPPDDYYDCPKCVEMNNKSDAMVIKDMLDHFGPYCDDDDGISVGDIERWIQSVKPFNI